jgi:hypothetical protein
MQTALTETEFRSAMRPLPAKARSALRPLILFGLSALVIFLSAPAGVRAATITIGTQGFNAGGEVITPNTGDITTSTVFNFGNFGSTDNQTGIFVGMPNELFGPLTLTVSSGTGFDFSDSVFGDFVSSSITPIFVGLGVATYALDGTWTPGTFSGFSGLTGPLTANITMAFTQVGGPGTAPSFSGTLDITEVSAVPEPSSIVLVLTALIAGVVLFRFRRSRSTSSCTELALSGLALS